jgi:hypothetical protein
MWKTRRNEAIAAMLGPSAMIFDASIVANFYDNKGLL